MSKKSNEQFVEDYILPNGLHVVLHHMPWSYAVSCKILIHAGSRYEDTHTAGIAHFLEHMLYEGTTHYPNPGQIRRAIGEMGGYDGAYTNKEYVVYSVKLPVTKEVDAMTFLYEILTNPLLMDAAIEREKGIVTQEIDREKDNIESNRWDILFEHIHPAHGTLQMHTLGTKESIQQIDRQKLLRYMQTFYVPQNMVLAVSGSFDAQKIKDSITQTFGTMPPSKMPIPSYIPVTLASIPREIFIDHFPSQSQEHILLAFPTDIFHYHPQEGMFDVLNIILQNRIFYALVYDLGIAYSAGGFIWSFYDHSYDILSAEVSTANVQRSLGRMIEELNKPITLDDLQKAKEQMKGMTFIDMADPDQFTTYIGEQLLYQTKVRSPQEFQEEIDAVSFDEITAMQERYIRRNNMASVFLGPLEQSEKKQLSSVLRTLQ